MSYDPAGAYDLPSYDVIYNVYQNLLTIPAGGNKPEPEAAESCDFTDDTTYECKQVAAVRDGVEGVKDTFDPSFIFRYWLISKK